jgi:site-specific DNA-methyltransferase (cytosine-N4-specific)
MDNVLTKIPRKTKVLDLNIETIKSVNNPNSIHGIYPYRGKISAIDARSVIQQLHKGVLLDPFCGSGTIIYEACLFGFDTIGIDSNPLANWIAKGKMSSLQCDYTTTIAKVEKLIKEAKLKQVEIKETTPLLKKSFHEETLKEIKSLLKSFKKMDNYIQACFLGALALTARGCNQYKWTSSTVGKDIQPKQYIDFYSKFLQKTKKHLYNNSSNNSHAIHHHDSRNLSEIVKANSVDFVFTSPPYFDALDYTAYYGQIIYELFEIERIKIKKNLIQNSKTYEDDMRKVLDEIVKVTKKDALIIFVVGDKKMKNSEIINGGEFFSKLLKHKPNKIIERKYTGSSSQIFDKLNKTERKEQIVIWDKSTWK